MTVAVLFHVVYSELAEIMEAELTKDVPGATFCINTADISIVTICHGWIRYDGQAFQTKVFG